tara:strand:+ start:103 stop:510 length:408 start_codon:yes stop_codon:yes gene_type:complete
MNHTEYPISVTSSDCPFNEELSGIVIYSSYCAALNRQIPADQCTKGNPTPQSNTLGQKRELVIRLTILEFYQSILAVLLTLMSPILQKFRVNEPSASGFRSSLVYSSFSCVAIKEDTSHPIPAHLETLFVAGSGE